MGFYTVTSQQKKISTKKKLEAKGTRDICHKKVFFILRHVINLEPSQIQSKCIPGAGHLFWYVINQSLKANSAFYPSVVGI